MVFIRNVTIFNMFFVGFNPRVPNNRYDFTNLLAASGNLKAFMSPHLQIPCLKIPKFHKPELLLFKARLLESFDM